MKIDRDLWGLTGDMPKDEVDNFVGERLSYGESKEIKASIGPLFQNYETSQKKYEVEYTITKTNVATKTVIAEDSEQAEIRVENLFKKGKIKFDEENAEVDIEIIDIDII